MPHILIYDDAPVFGGHEVTLCDGIAAVAEISECRISVVVSRKNNRFITKLSEIGGNIDIIRSDFEAESGDSFRALFRSKKVREIQKLILRHNPDLVVISQGSIGLSLCGLRAAQLLDKKTLSFIPMAHPVRLVRGENNVVVKLQEQLYKKFYQWPDYFLTICKSSKSYLQNHYSVDSSNIFLSYYGVDVTIPPVSNYTYERVSTNKRKQIGIIGRVEYYQKRHDFFFKNISSHPLIDHLDIHIVGDGPDQNNCEMLVKGLKLTKHVTFHGWVNNISSWYSELDLIVMPSRFEGLPIVVLEAMYHGVPVVASNVDGMKEMLPPHWLFSQGNGEMMNSTITEVLSNDQRENIDRNRHIIISQFNLEVYKRSFKACISSILQGS
jgi:glycosyltransferase involved in cell wall biosynthesis